MTKGPILQDIWDKLSEERKARIQAQISELKTKYLKFRSFRKSVDDGLDKNV